MKVIFFSKDLLFSSQVKQLCEMRQVPYQGAMSMEKVNWVAGDQHLALVDLTSIAGPVSDWKTKYVDSVSENVTWVAYAPHVQVDLLQQAKEAGFANVLVRGQVVGGVESWLAAC